MAAARDPSVAPIGGIDITGPVTGTRPAKGP